MDKLLYRAFSVISFAAKHFSNIFFFVPQEKKKADRTFIFILSCLFGVVVRVSNMAHCHDLVTNQILSVYCPTLTGRWEANDSHMPAHITAAYFTVWQSLMEGQEL